MLYTDVFLCYRRYGAQTAKLFYKYLREHNFPAKVWYSDINKVGNYKDDIGGLVESAKSIVIFIDDKFTKDFLKTGGLECITALEICAIANKLLNDKDVVLLTVFLDRKGFTKKENKILTQLFINNNISDPDKAVSRICQNNIITFSTSIDLENELFKELSEVLFSAKQIKRDKGDFHLGNWDTSADIMIWDEAEGIKAENIRFYLDADKPPLYDEILETPVDMALEKQNNEMISLTKFTAYLSDNTESKNINISYQLIDYNLFSTTLNSRESYQIKQAISGYHKGITYQAPNAMGMAFMVITKDKKLILSKRSESRRIRSGEYDCSIVEGLKPKVFENGELLYKISDPLYLNKEIERSFMEEICVSTQNKYKIYGVVLDREYGQWNFVGTIKTELTADEIIRIHSVRNDSYEDNELFVYDFLKNGQKDRDQLREQLYNIHEKEIWGMALTALYASLLELGYNNDDIFYATRNKHLKTEVDA